MNAKVLILLWFVLCTMTSYSYENLFKKKEKFKPTIANGLSLISVGSGWGFTSTIVNDPNNFLSNPFFMNSTYIPSVSFEYGTKINLNLEGGFLRQKIGVAYERMFDQVGNSIFYPLYNRHYSMSIGISSKLNIRNFNIIQGHLGVFSGVSSEKSKVNQGLLVSEYFIDAETNNTFGVTTKLINERKASFGFYIGASKSIALSEKVLFEVKYNHRFGLRRLAEGDYLLSSSQISFSDTPVDFKVKGGGGFLSLSLKIVLFNKNSD